MLKTGLFLVFALLPILSFISEAQISKWPKKIGCNKIDFNLCHTNYFQQRTGKRFERFFERVENRADFENFCGTLSNWKASILAIRQLKYVHDAQQNSHQQKIMVTCHFVLRHFNRCNFNRSHFQPFTLSTACLFDRLQIQPPQIRPI